MAAPEQLASQTTAAFCRFASMVRKPWIGRPRRISAHIAQSIDRILTGNPAMAALACGRQAGGILAWNAYVTDMLSRAIRANGHAVPDTAFRPGSWTPAATRELNTPEFSTGARIFA